MEIDQRFVRDLADALANWADRVDAGRQGDAGSRGFPTDESEGLPTQAGASATSGGTSSAFDRAYESIRGHRQRQMLAYLYGRGGDGAPMADISRSIDYDEPNVYNTLHVLKTRGLVERIESTVPQRWRLSEHLGTATDPR